jgi:putative endonuclease
MWKVYVIKSKEDLIYTGITSNLEKRLKDHNSGASRWTKRGNHWFIVYSDDCFSAKEARRKHFFYSL